MSAASPVRNVELALDLADFGAVTLRVSVSGPALTVRVSAERADTVHALQRERDALTDALEQAGYDAEIVAIDMRPQSAGGAATPAPGAAAAFGGFLDDADSRRFDQGRPRPRPPRSDADTDSADRIGDRRAGLLYV
jgi:hypothetical protein